MAIANAIPKVTMMLVASALLSGCFSHKVTPSLSLSAPPAQPPVVGDYSLEVVGAERLNGPAPVISTVCSAHSFQVDFAGRASDEIATAFGKRWASLRPTSENSPTPRKVTATVEQASYHLMCGFAESGLGHCTGQAKVGIALDVLSPKKTEAKLRTTVERRVRQENIVSCDKGGEVLSRAIQEATDGALSDLLARPELSRP